MSIVLCQMSTVTSQMSPIICQLSSFTSHYVSWLYQFINLLHIARGPRPNAPGPVAIATPRRLPDVISASDPKQCKPPSTWSKKILSRGYPKNFQSKFDENELIGVINCFFIFQSFLSPEIK